MTSPSRCILALDFKGDTRELLKKRWRTAAPVIYPLQRRASIKDVIEAVGVPHTEVGRLLLDNRELDFSFIPEEQAAITILPRSREQPCTQPSRLRPEPLTELRFMVDLNVARVARLLRLAGIDAEPVPPGSGRVVAETAAAAGRILLSADRELLKQSAVIFGRLIRSRNPERQFLEVADLYRLQPLFKPFSRCLECNRPLLRVAKESILDRLEPLTRRYYHCFKRCDCCDRIYWRGSHHNRMSDLLGGLLPDYTDQYHDLKKT